MRNKIQMKALVTSILDDLPDSFKYHNTQHTFNVLTNTIFIACSEEIDRHAIELLMTAALWHDTGFTINYKEHEKEGCRLVAEHLPEFGYSENEIAIVQELIMATKLPYIPEDPLSKILMDADLAYLGTSLAYKRSIDLYTELVHFNPEMTPESWNRTQINFLESHHYFTDYARRFLEPNKQEYLNFLRHETV
jgi:uncharacterized protein